MAVRILHNSWKVRRCHSGLYSHHSAADIDSNSGWDNCFIGGNHAPNSGTFTKMHVGHCRYPPVDEWQLSKIGQLLYHGISH